MPKLDPATAPTYDGHGPVADHGPALGPYQGHAIGQMAGFVHLGANVETLLPGSASSHRHWHECTDELVVVLSGTLMLVEDDGETMLKAGDIAGFAAGVANGHCLQNRSDTAATFLVVGSRDPCDRCHYADLGLVLHPDGTLTAEDGTPVGRS